MRRDLLLACTIASALSIAPSALAQRTASDVETARELYRQGLTMREKGDVKGALEKFKAAHALAKTPITGLELCKTHAALSQPVEAREVCLGVSRIPPSSEETSRSAEARAEAAKIAEEVKPKIASVHIVLRGVPPGRTPTVTIDGRAVPPAALSQPLMVNPGPHEVVARVETGPEARSTIETREGEGRQVDLTVQAPAGPPPGPAAPPGWQPQPGPEEPPPKKKSPLVTVGIGVAGVGVAAGLITGFMALNAKNKLDQRCIDQLCGRSEHSDLDEARTFGTVSTVSFVIAGAGVALAVIGFASSSSSSGAAAPPARVAKTPRPEVKPYLGLGAAGVHGTF